LKRRTFLKALAIALNIDPARLILPKEAKRLDPGITAPGNVWMPVQYIESVIIPRGVELLEEFGFPPLPSNMVIRRLYTHLDSHDCYHDWKQVLDAASLKMQMDGKTFMEAPLALVTSGFGLNGASQTYPHLFPPIVPQGDFKISVAARKLDLTAEQMRVHVVVDGAVQIQL
jgi:hypothetical protein